MRMENVASFFTTMFGGKHGIEKITFLSIVSVFFGSKLIDYGYEYVGKNSILRPAKTKILPEEEGEEQNNIGIQEEVDY